MKEKSKLREKFFRKNINNEDDNCNQCKPIKYFCYNAVKKIVNNKNKHFTNKINEIKKVKKEEEDEYNKSIYNKKLLISHNLSFSNSINKEYNNLANKYNSTDERFKSLYKFGFYSKRIFFNLNKNNSKIPKSKFSKICKIKAKNKTKLNKNLFDTKIINGMAKNIIYRLNNINELIDNKENNTNACKTLTNNVLSILSNFNKTNSYYYKIDNTNTNENNSNFHNLSYYEDFTPSENKKYNKKIMKSKRNQKNSKIKKGGKEVYIRRIVLEEKYTIDSNGEIKRIYIRKISPSIKVRNEKVSRDKSLKRNNMDNSFINDRNINLDLNRSSFQQINLNRSDHKSRITAKISNFNNNYKKNINNSKTINDKILQNYKYLYKDNKNNGCLSFFQSPKKGYLINIIDNNLEKKNSKINNINNKQNTIKGIILNKTPFKYQLNNSGFIRSKKIDRKSKIDYNLSYNDEKNKSIISQKSNSFLPKTPLNNLSKKSRHDCSKLLNTSIQNQNNINKLMIFPSKVSSTSSNNNSIKNSFINANIKIINKKNKFNLYINLDNNNICDNLRKKSSNKISNNKNNRYMKLFLKYLKNDIIVDDENNESQRNFHNKKFEKYI